MSVRVNDRNTSDIEYENTFYKINAYLSDKLKRAPKRYSDVLVNPFNDALNGAYNHIMEATNEALEGRYTSISRYRTCAEILADIGKVTAHIYAYWNLSGGKADIKYVTARQREYMTGMINRETALVMGVMAKCRKDSKIEPEAAMMTAYTKHDLSEAIFLQKLADLERIVYRKAAQNGKGYRDPQMEMLVTLSRDAFYYACTGNFIRTDGNEKLAKRRERYFTDAISCLMKMNRPIRELAFDHIFSEKELEDICCLSADAQKILRTIRDGERSRVTA